MADEVLTTDEATETKPTVNEAAVLDWLNDRANQQTLNRILQPRVDQAITNWKERNLARSVEDEINKRFPPETEEAKQIRDLTAKFAEMQNEKALEQRRGNILRALADKGLPTDLADFAVAEDDETTQARLARLVGLIDSTKTTAVTAALATGTAKPAGTGGQIDPRASLEAAKEEALQRGDFMAAVALENQKLKEVN
jgi:hypothetical protein